jgi:hypothetical protein
MKPEDFAAAEPRFAPEDYFVGTTRAWGIFEDRFGNLRRQFVVDIVGVWDGRELVLDEDFTFTDGERNRRVWRIMKRDAHTYEGIADDVIGTARGRVYGNAMHWEYDMELRVGDDTWTVSFDDWMFLQQGDVLINRARVKKWGITVGETTLFFSKGTGEFNSHGRKDPNGAGISRRDSAS